MPEAPLPWLVAGLGILVVAAGVVLVRSSGADVRTGRRLAGAPAHSLVELRDLARDDRLPKGPIRVSGRVRCADPILTPDGDRLAALHRDVEVRLPDGRWRTIEHLRQARPTSVWERTVSVGVDLARLAEPLISIPQVWEGPAHDLGIDYRSAVDRVGAVTAARSTVRQVTLVDQVLVLGVPGRDPGGQLRLEPPPGGFVVSTVELDVAMRLLAGPHRPRMVTGFVTAAGGMGLVIIGVLAAVLGWTG